MSYAIRNDGLGFRAVESEDDCLETEHWQEELPVLDAAPMVEPVDPIQKLADFLAANPDVASKLSEAAK